jgi:uncharacterized protein
MIVGIARISLQLIGVGSLKGKRRVVRSVVDRARAKFNAAVAEVEDNDSLRRAVIGVTVLGNNGGHVDSMLQRVCGFVERTGLAPISAIETETIAFGKQVGDGPRRFTGLAGSADGGDEDDGLSDLEREEQW